jgi:hypothetical protein
LKLFVNYYLETRQVEWNIELLTLHAARTRTTRKKKNGALELKINTIRIAKKNLWLADLG